MMLEEVRAIISSPLCFSGPVNNLVARGKKNEKSVKTPATLPALLAGNKYSANIFIHLFGVLLWDFTGLFS